MVHADGAGADADDGDFQAGLAEAHLIGRILDGRVEDEARGLGGGVGVQSATGYHASAERARRRERDEIAAAQLVHIPSCACDGVASA